MTKFFTPSSGAVTTSAPKTMSASAGFSDQGEVIKTAALMDLFTTGGKNLTKITTLGDLLNPTPTATQQKTIDAQAKKDEVKRTAQSLQTLITNKSSMDPKIYEDTKNSIASDLYVKMKEAANMGAALSASEIGIMAGQAPAIQQIGPSAGSKVKQFFTGEVPVQHGRVADDEQTLQNKLNIIVNGQNAPPLPQNNQVQQQTSQTGGLMDILGGKQPVNTLNGQETLKPNLIQNVGNNLLDIVKGVPGLAQAGANLTPIGGLQDIMQGKAPDPFKPYKTLVGMGAGIINNFGETVGVTKDDQGNITWSPTAAYVHDFNHPVDTALWILPALKALKGAEGANIAEKGTTILDQAAKDITKTDLGATTKAGKAARSVATIVPESVVKSEEIMGKALQYTKSNTLEGMAKELETSISTQGKIIDSWTVAKDARIGPQPVAQIVDEVMQKVNQSTAAKANPELASLFETDLTRQLESGQLGGGMAKGELAGTDFTTVNKTRKYLISGKDAWFNNGQPVGSPTNDLNAIEFAGSNALKDIMSTADPEGIIKNALDQQHTAYQTYPVLSKMVSKKGPGVSAISLKWSLIRKAYEATIGKVVESSQIKNARGLQGVAPDSQSLLQNMLQGQKPQVEDLGYSSDLSAVQNAGPTKTITPPMPERTLPTEASTLYRSGGVQGNPTFKGAEVRQLPTAKKAMLPLDIIQNMLKSKGPAQKARLLRDLGGPNTRALQDLLLRNASKRKYK